MCFELEINWTWRRTCLKLHAVVADCHWLQQCVGRKKNKEHMYPAMCHTLPAILLSQALSICYRNTYTGKQSDVTFDWFILILHI